VCHFYPTVAPARQAGVALRCSNTGLQDGRLGMVRCNTGQGYVTTCNNGNLGAGHASNDQMMQWCIIATMEGSS